MQHVDALILRHHCGTASVDHIAGMLRDQQDRARLARNLGNAVQHQISRGRSKHIAHHIGVQQSLPHKSHGNGFVARPVADQQRDLLIRVFRIAVAHDHTRIAGATLDLRIGADEPVQHVIDHGFGGVKQLFHAETSISASVCRKITTETEPGSI